MISRSLNVATRWVVLVPWLVWLAWELALVLWLRPRYPGTRTISMEASRVAARGFSTLAFFWAGMASHWFLPRRPLGGDRVEAVCAVAFWVLGALFLLADVFDPRRLCLPLWVQWIRWYPIACLVGLAAGFLLFPQRQVGGTPEGP